MPVSPGTGFVAEANSGQFVITVLVTEDLKNKNIAGLLGNYNGRPDDDLTDRNGNQIVTTSTAATIYTSVGLSCKSSKCELTPNSCLYLWHVQHKTDKIHKTYK